MTYPHQPQHPDRSQQPGRPREPRHSREPHHPHHAYHPHLPPHDSSPSYPTYPWQPVAPTPPPPRPRLPRHPALGRHSDLRHLRSAYRWQRRVATLTALGYFTLFLVLSAFAPALMTDPVSGGLTTGLLLGLCQVPVTLIAIALYEFTARRRVDPLAERLRKLAELEANR
ncbi:hypothetical protein GCM10010277_49520 [Streptomyces longisporoflavus]|uniref:DUF485 domain-containing protein n=1 Tax=Streptomyces longisporoflavus TaxID=28044 RepID=UPI00167D411E|nr:DUF485 domain-containing protein [Streptomyces longisporoflavus]GGV52675.1 hypothetical protein GCM10010277_49520 [Streptomyces longisporoflavus]